MKILVLAAAAALAVPAASSARTNGNLCAVARGVAADIARTTTLDRSGTASVTRANLKNEYEKVYAAEPSLVAAASGRTKTALQKVFVFVNLARADLRRVGWSADRLGPYLPALATAARKATAPLDSVRAYLRQTCKLNI